jgi:hypothetical protein
MYKEIRVKARVKQPNKETKIQCDDQDLTGVHFSFKFSIKYSITPLIQSNWDGEASGYAEIRIIGFFLNRVHWKFEVRLLLFTVRTCV